MKPLILLLLATLPWPSAHAEQFFDIKNPELESFEIKTPCKAVKQSGGLVFGEVNGSFVLTLRGGAQLTITSTYAFSAQHLERTEALACAGAKKELFSDGTFRSWVNSFEALRTRSPIFDDENSRRCVLPSIRIFAARAVKSIAAEETQWISNPVTCPQL